MCPRLVPDYHPEVERVAMAALRLAARCAGGFGVAAIARSGTSACQASAAGGDTPTAVSAPQGDAQMSQRFLEARRVFLNGAVNDESANRLVAELLYLEAASPGTPIDLYINSSGGSLWGGFAVYDTMRAISSPVRTICIGRCRSMAAVLLAAGEPGERYAAASARLMIHQPSWSFDSHDGAASKSATNVTAEAAECEAQRKHWAATLAVLTGRDAAELDARMAHDHYLTAEEARELGIVDRLLRSVVASTVADGKPGVEGVPEKPSSP